MPPSPSSPIGSWWSCSGNRSRPGPLRRLPTARVDLHCHSTASDGEYPPAEVARRRRAEQIVSRLRRWGVTIGLGDIVLVAEGGALGRPHVARVLVQRGVCYDMNDAFARYLGRGRPAYVEKPLPTLSQVADLVHVVGGVAVAAHLGDHGTEGQIRQFHEHGLDGLEGRHPSHSPGTERRLTGIAQRLGMAISGGSDWHGDQELGDSHAPLGGLDVPFEWLEKLEERRATTSSENVAQNRRGIS